MKGYRLKQPPVEFVLENILVGCKRCRRTWREEMSSDKNGCRINGAAYYYDVCDKCITEKDVVSE